MASGPFVCCRELVPPTCLEHCVFARLWSDENGLPQLVTASSGQVYIYSQAMGRQGKVVLRLDWSSRVYGLVEALFAIPQKTQAEDTLLFVFDEGKMALCGFDRQRMQLATLKLWNAEEHAIGVGSDYVGDSRGRNHPLGAGRTPLTAVSSRGLACTLLYGHQLLFYPTQLESAATSQFSMKPLLVTLEDISIAGAVIDICFVEGYLMPAVAILQELGGGLPVGHLASCSSTCAVYVLAVDVIARETRILWSKTGLPHNSCRLISVSDPLQHNMLVRGSGPNPPNRAGLGESATNGETPDELLPEYSTHALSYTSDVSDKEVALPRQLLVITSNAILLVDSVETLGVATNGYAALTVDMSKIPLQPVSTGACVELDAARWVVQRTQPPRLLGVLNNGKMIAVDVLLSPDGLQRLTRFRVEELAQTVRASCLSGFGKGDQIESLCIGSRSHDSLLVELEIASPVENENDISKDQGGPAKRLRKSSDDGEHAAPSDLTAQEEEEMLYGLVYTSDTGASNGAAFGVQALAPASSELDFHVLDVIPTLGPISKCRFTPLTIDDFGTEGTSQRRWDLSHGSPHSSVGSDSKRPDMKGIPLDARSSLLVLSGDSVDTSLHVMNRGVRGRLLASRELTDVIGLVCCPIKELGTSYVFLSTLQGTRALVVSEGAVERSHVKRPSTREQKDNVIHILDAKEISLDSIGLAKSEVTLAAGVVFGRLLVQICPTAIRVIDVVAGTPIQDMVVDDEVDVGGLGAPSGNTIVKAEITPHGEALVVLSSRELRLLKYSEEDQAFVIADFRAQSVAMCGSVLRDRSIFSDCSLLPAKQSKPTYETRNTEGGEFTPAAEGLQEFTEEEAVLYGVPLDTDLSAMAATTTTHENGQEEDERPMTTDGFTMSVRQRKQAEDLEVDADDSGEGTQLYCALVSAAGRLEIYDTSQEGKLVFTNADIGVAPPILENQLHSSSDVTPSQVARVKQVSMLRLTERSTSYRFSTLAMVVVYDTNDFALYRASEDGQQVHCWVKVEHEIISRPRREQIRDVRRRSRGNDDLSAWGHGVQVQTFNDATRNGWLISGTVSAIVSLRKGYPTVLPFSPNRLPRKRDFTICLSPLRTTSCTAIAALEKSLRSRHGAKDPQLSTYLRIYEADVSSKIHPLVPSQLGGCQISLKATARQIVELRPLTDDVTQKQILATPTFAFATYRQVPVDFDAELEREQLAFAHPEDFPDVQLHDRFYDAQNPYALPDPEVGPTPLMFEDKYSVVLVQEGKIIDRFELNDHEHVIDMEQLSVEVPETEATADNVRDSAKKDSVPPSAKANRRVLLAVSTGHIDPHGEDTQGEGRLLVFDIDFAHYQEEIDRDTEAETSDQVPMQLDDATAGKEDRQVQEAAAGASTEAAKPDQTSAVEEGEAEEGEAITAPADDTVTHVESEQGTGRRLVSVMQPKLRVVWSGFGPSTVVRQFNQYVLSTVGCTLFVYGYDGTGLEQVSFFRAQYYIVDIKVVRNFIIIADIYRSVQFLTWREHDKSLTLLAKDYEPCPITALDILVEMPRMAIVTCDNDRNVKLLQYDPRRAVESKKGFRLLCTADFHIGHRAASMVPHQTASVSLDISDRKQTFVVFGTMEGGVALLMPIEERIHRRLALLQHILAMALMHTCSLNPREYRLYKSPTFRVEKKRGVLDANLLWRYIHLDFRQREEIAEVMGTSVETIIDSLLEIDLATQVF